MLRFKNLNNISDELLKQIPPMKSGEEIVFQMLNGHPNNDQDRNEREKNPVLYGKTQIDTKVRIKDPYANKIVDIGVPQVVENESVITFKPFLAGMHDDQFQGKFSLFGGNTNDEEFYEIFWLSPQREGSPCADSAVKPIFKIVNAKEETKKVLGKLDELRKAIKTFDAMSDAQIMQFAASQNWGGGLDDMKSKVGEFAKSYPDKFIAANEDPNLELKSIVKNAIDKNILIIEASRKVKVGTSELFTLSKDAMNDQLTAVANWLNSAKNGKEVLEGIKKQLNADTPNG